MNVMLLIIKTEKKKQKKRCALVITIMYTVILDVSIPLHLMPEDTFVRSSIFFNKKYNTHVRMSTNYW